MKVPISLWREGGWMIIHAFSVGWIRFSSVGCCHQESSHPRSAHSAAFIVHISCCHFCFFDTLIRLFPLPENDLIPGVKCFFGFRQAAQVALFSDIFDRCAAAFQADDPLHPVDGFFVKDAVVGLIALARYGCQYNSGWYVLSYGTSRQIVSMYRSSFLLKWSKSY